MELILDFIGTQINSFRESGPNPCAGDENRTCDPTHRRPLLSHRATDVDHFINIKTNFYEYKPHENVVFTLIVLFFLQ